MIRTECRRLINYLFDNGKINEKKQEECLEYMNFEWVHIEIRNLIMCILLPKKLHFDGEHQEAFLRAAVSRVRNFNFFNSLFQIANQTVLEQEGLLFLRPVYDLLFYNYLELTRSSVSVCYKTYHNTYKPGIQTRPDVLSLQDAVDQELTPGKILTRRHYNLF